MPRIANLPAELLAVLERQDGVATVEQLQAGGISRRTADKRVSRGTWRRPLPGIYLTTSAPPTRRQRLVAGWLWGGPGAAIDGADALAAWHGFTPPRHDPLGVHVVVPCDAVVRSRDFVVVRRALAEIDIAGAGYVPYVDAATGFIVAARSAGSVDEAVDLLSRGLQKRVVTIAALDAARDRIGDKWCARVDAALVAVRTELRSPAERWMYDVWRQSRILPEPRWNEWLDLGDGGPEVQVDALIAAARLVNEVNGKAHHAWGQQFEKTSERHERLVAAGLISLETTALRVRRQPQQVLRAWEQTFLRYDGMGLPPNVRVVPPPHWWLARIAV